MKWVVFTNAPSQPMAETWADLLNKQQIPCCIHAGDINTFMGTNARSVRLMTLEGYEEQAKAYLADIFPDQDGSSQAE